MEKIEAYRAKDGTLFSSKVECLKHEGVALPRMFGPDGHEVYDDNNAHIVVIPNAVAAKSYKEICVLPEQFAYADPEEGIYVWNLHTEEMSHIPMYMVKNILRVQENGMDLFGLVENLEEVEWEY